MSAPSPQRIVSLLPAATEILGLLESEHLLVGRSHECDYPPSVRRAPILSRQRVAPASPAEIDRAVRDHLAMGESLYLLDADALRAARPDIILTQDVCQVCSIDLATVRRVASAMEPSPTVVSLNPGTLQDVLDDVLRVGKAIGQEARAGRAVVRLRERLARAQDYVNAYEEGPSVALLEWTDPLFCAGHWSAQLIEQAGGRHLLNASAGPPPTPPGPSRAITPEELLAAGPEYLIVCPCGAGLERTRTWAKALQAHAWWWELPAVRRGRVALIDGNQMFNRPGPRLVDAYEFLVGWLHGVPGLIPPDFPWELLR